MGEQLQASYTGASTASPSSVHAPPLPVVSTKPSPNERAAAKVGLYVGVPERQQQLIDRLWDQKVIGATRPYRRQTRGPGREGSSVVVVHFGPRDRAWSG